MQYPSQEDWQQQEWLDEEPVMIRVREVVYDPLEAPTMLDIEPTPPSRPTYTHLRRQRRGILPLTLILLLGFLMAAGVVGYFTYNLLPQEVKYIVVDGNTGQAATTLSPVFTKEVQYWAADIEKWAVEYNLDPNLIATVIQIESCGDPTVSSNAGAQGLFQVMPFHFTQGEDMLDVQTNAKRGLAYLSGGLAQADGHPGLALAGYNGGHGVINLGWARWAEETRRYFYWGAGIYEEASEGKLTSERLNEWLSAGGNSLCVSAASVQSTLPRS
jgi:hypothetical protein